MSLWQNHRNTGGRAAGCRSRGPRSGLDEVFDGPAGDNRIEAENHERGKNADISGQLPVAPTGGLVGTKDVAAGAAPQYEFGAYNRDSEDKDEQDITKHEGASTVSSGFVGESPNIAEADGRSCCRGDGAQTRHKYGPVVLIVHCFSSRNKRSSGRRAGLSLDLLSLLCLESRFSPRFRLLADTGA